MNHSSSQIDEKIVWNRKARTLHWGLAICVIVNFINDGDGSRDLHAFVGYLAAAIMMARICYGLWNGRAKLDHSKFYYWPLQWRELVRFVTSELKKTPIIYDGHNPLACVVYGFIWIMVGLLAISGFMMGLDQFWGEEWLEELHELFSDGLIGLLILHFTGLVKDAVSFRRKTWTRMIHGRKI